MSETHFGFEKVDETEKAGKVAGVFHSVASKYDVMNDLMSGGMHRLWKMFTIAQAGVRPGYKVLDIAGGTGDLAKAFAKQGRPDRPGLADRHQRVDAARGPRPAARQGHRHPGGAVRCRAHPVPGQLLRPGHGGVRPAQHDSQGRRTEAEMRRVVKPGGKVMVLEFSKVWKPLEYRPTMNTRSRCCRGSDRRWRGMPRSYRYLAESIRMHPDQISLVRLMEQAGLENVEYFNLTAGVVALHVGRKY
ncbi:class I SAM-dependent methyltransferase [Cupriavidus basilensis]